MALRRTNPQDPPPRKHSDLGRVPSTSSTRRVSHGPVTVGPPPPVGSLHTPDVRSPDPSRRPRGGGVGGVRGTDTDGTWGRRTRCHRDVTDGKTEVEKRRGGGRVSPRVGGPTLEEPPSGSYLHLTTTAETAGGHGDGRTEWLSRTVGESHFRRPVPEVGCGPGGRKGGQSRVCHPRRCCSRNNPRSPRPAPPFLPHRSGSGPTSETAGESRPSPQGFRPDSRLVSVSTDTRRGWRVRRGTKGRDEPPLAPNHPPNQIPAPAACPAPGRMVRASPTRRPRSPTFRLLSLSGGGPTWPRPRPAPRRAPCMGAPSSPPRPRPSTGAGRAPCASTSRPGGRGPRRVGPGSTVRTGVLGH